MRIRFAAMACVLVILLTVFPSPVRAAETYTSKSTFWSWLASPGSVPYATSLFHKVIGYIMPSGCPESDDGRHHATSYQVDRQNGYYTCICSDCGQTFKAYKQDIDQAYRTYTQSLPGTLYSNSGEYSRRITGWWGWPEKLSGVDFLGNSSTPEFDAICVKGASFSYLEELISGTFTVPVTGMYTIEMSHDFIAYGIYSREVSFFEICEADYDGNPIYTNVGGFPRGLARVELSRWTELGGARLIKNRITLQLEASVPYCLHFKPYTYVSVQVKDDFDEVTC